MRAAAVKPPGSAAPVAVVGIGASAGGLEALKEFFQAMPANSGMAFVVVQHLEPDHHSQMADILAKHTPLRVREAEDGQKVDANCVYTIPASKYLSIQGGRLHLTEPAEQHGRRMPIDFFFRSLAEDQQARAVCIVLSGSSGSDGSQGLRAVRGGGGMCMVQDPRTAQFGVMPQSAIDTGLADHVLPAGEMPAALLAYVRHHYIAPDNTAEEDSAGGGDTLSAILNLLRSRTNSDFRRYKKGTVLRRIQRRMGLRECADLANYLELIRKEPAELVQLGKDMLIGVSSFFRDGEAFSELATLAIGPLIAGKSPDSPLRVWVAGCATGEEAYSIAMLLLEGLAAAGKHNPVQVFASDVDEDGLSSARVGRYPETIAADVSADRLAKFFIRREGHYQVGKQLREAVVFARQNLISDPPFSRMDLVACRNVLIYLEPEAQRKVLSIFSFSLNVGGFLFLGKSEAIGERTDLFETVSKGKRIYRLAHANRRAADLPVFAGTPQFAGPVKERGESPPTAAELADLNQRVLLGHFDAAVVLVDARGRIVHFFGQTEKYFTHPAGQASLNVLDMTAGSLAAKLRTAISRVVTSGEPVTLSQTPLSRTAGAKFANVTVLPAPGRARADKLVAIILEEARAPVAPSAGPAKAVGAVEDESVVAQFETEVKALRGELDASNEEHESTNEELKAANEEMMSMNEELQSANEELETSKEELQSINEELNTVNSQLGDKVGELTETTNDLANLFTATEIATLFLDADLRIKRFTPRMSELLNLLAADAGRPLGDITQKFEGSDLAADAAKVLADLAVIEKEIQSQGGQWFTMRILPYRTLDNRIDGVVVTFAEVSRLKRAEAALQNAKAYAEQIVATVREPLIVLDPSLRVMSANPAFYTMFQTAPKATVGASVFALSNGQWENPELRRLLEEVIPAHSKFDDFQVERDLPRIGRRTLCLNGRQIELEPGQPPLILLAIEDITEREHARRRTKAVTVELEKRVKERTAELVKTVADLETEVRERLKATESLRQSEEQYRQLFSDAPVGIGLAELDGTLLAANEALTTMFGATRQDLIGQNVGRLYANEAERQRFLAELMKARSVRSMEMPFKRKDGTVFPVLLDAHIVTVGGRERVLTTIQDFSEHRRLEREILEATEREQRRIGQDLHDSVQGSIVGMSYLAQMLAADLRRPNPNPADLATHADKISETLATTLQQTRNLARGLCPVSLGGDGLRMALDQLAATTAELFRMACSFRCDGQLQVEDETVATQLYYIAQEAINNSLKHAKAKTITVSLGDGSGGLTLAVEDDGVGIPDDRGEQVGLGMRTMGYRAKLIGGSLEIARGASQGTVVRCVLRGLVASPKKAALSPPPEPAAAPPRGRKRRPKR